MSEISAPVSGDALAATRSLVRATAALRAQQDQPEGRHAEPLSPTAETHARFWRQFNTPIHQIGDQT